MVKSTSYGHRHLSLFYKEVLVVQEQVFIYKRTTYLWSAIRQIEIWQKPWPGFGHIPGVKLLPRAWIRLFDGSSILLRGDVLTKRDIPVAKGFQSAFDEIVALFKEKKKAHQKTEYDSG